MPNTNINRHPRTGFDDFQITGANLSGDQSIKNNQRTIPTIPTAAGTVEVLFCMQAAGTVSAVRTLFKEALTAHDTNFVSVRLVNLGQAGAGTTDVILATDANSTKITGGTAFAAYTRRVWSLGSGANLTVALGDVLALRITGNGTLANTLTEGAAQVFVLVTT